MYFSIMQNIVMMVHIHTVEYTHYVHCFVWMYIVSRVQFYHVYVRGLSCVCTWSVMCMYMVCHVYVHGVTQA